MLSERVRAELDRLVNSNAPIAVAYSGGGDSTALLHLLRQRAALAVIVDHGLSEGSADRTDLAASRAEAMGVETLVLDWQSPRPGHAHARTARYTLMGDALRARGINHLAVGHTADDQTETLTMRRRRHDLAGGMDPLSHAPVWPGLRGIDLVRPLLGVSRKDLRAYNMAHQLDWIEDPANDDLRHERVRVRRSKPVPLSNGTARRREAARMLDQIPGHIHFGMGHADCAGGTDLALIALALSCVAGTAELIPASRLSGLSAGRALTVGGGRIVPIQSAGEDEDGWRLLRDPGGVMGRSGVAALGDVELAEGEQLLWDDRILVTAHRDISLRALGTDWPKGPKRPHIDIRRTLPGAFVDGEPVAVPGWGDAATFEDVAKARLLGLLQARASRENP